MEPRIQYAQTKDGVSIAFATLGRGSPLVWMPWIPFSDIRILSAHRRDMEVRLAKSGMVVAYDNRGSGLSDREVTDQSLEAHLLDIQAVVEGVGLRKFALWGQGESAPVAIAYAARNPEQVSHLMLWCGWARHSDVWEGSRYPAFQALLQTGDWTLYTETMAAVSGWATREQIQRGAAAIREMVTEEAATAFWEAAREFDVSALLPDVKSPTLILHPSRVYWLPVDTARRLASRISGARLALIDTDVPFPWLGNGESLLSAIKEFLSEDEEAAGGEPLAKEDVHTILFTDMEGSTTLTQRLGDAKAQEVLRTHNTILRDALKAHSGSEIKHTGDGIMASFTSASRALECSIGIQRAFAQHNESNPDTPIRVRIGLNAGEPVAEEEDLFGTAVQLAARIAAKAEGEEILVSDTLRGLVAGKGFLFSDQGDVALRGFEDPVRLFEVRWRES